MKLESIRYFHVSVISLLADMQERNHQLYGMMTVLTDNPPEGFVQLQGESLQDLGS